MAAYRQNSTAPMGNFNQAAQHPMLEKAEQCNWVKNIFGESIIFCNLFFIDNYLNCV